MIEEARSDEDILASFEVMRQLRPDIAAGDYLPTVRRMMAEGYRLAASRDRDGIVRGVAGFRCFGMLYAGRILYVDDLVTDEASRSQGHGKALLDWLKAEAISAGCAQLHLDSGVQREKAHRFYFREGMGVNAYHFRVVL